MKSFQTYIAELSRPSEFRIKLAGVNPRGDLLDQIKRALDTYQLESISAVKSLPVQEHRDFPQWGGPCEAYQFDVSLAYPTNAVQVRMMIQERARVNPDWISVRNLHEAEYTDEAESMGKDHTGSVLLEPEMKTESGQEYAGQTRIGNLLKELESHKFEFAKANTEKARTTNEAPQGDVSPVGTHQNKKYTPPKG
jgi:hypothetical protein